MPRADLGTLLPVPSGGGKLRALLTSASAHALGLRVDGGLQETRARPLSVSLEGNPLRVNALPPSPAVREQQPPPKKQEQKQHGQSGGGGSGGQKASPEKQWLARIASHLREYQVPGPVMLSTIASPAAVPRPPGVAKSKSLKALLEKFGQKFGLRLCHKGKSMLVILDEQHEDGTGDSRSFVGGVGAGGGSSGDGTVSAGNAAEVVDARMADRQVKETALLFWNYVIKDVERMERCSRRHELEAEFLRFRERQNSAGLPLPTSIRSPSQMIRHLATQSRLIQLNGNEVTFEAATTKRHVKNAQKAAAQLIASREKMQNCNGVTIEPPNLECFAAVGEEVRQTFRIKNDASQPITITAVEFIKSPNGKMLVHPPGLPMTVAPGAEVCFDMTCKTDQPGMLTNVLMFAFRSSVAPFQFKICRVISIRAGNKEIEELLKPSRPFARAKVARGPAASQVVDGEAPARAALLPYVNPLARFEMPSFFRDMMEKEDRNADEFLLNLQQKSVLVEHILPECPETYILNPRMGALMKEVYTSKFSLDVFGVSACKLCGKSKDQHYTVTSSRTGNSFLFCCDPRLTLEKEKCSTYSMLYSHLLWAEERAMERDIRAYDMEAAPLHAEQGYLSLHVPGLSENRPSVLRGDAVMARPPWDSVKEYKGYAHRIEMERVLLKFSHDLHQKFVNNMKFRITFGFRRTNLRAMHQGVSEAVIDNTDLLRMSYYPYNGVGWMSTEDGGKLGSMLFPSLKDLPLEDSVTDTSLEEYCNKIAWFDRHLNPEQRRAVGNILLAQVDGLTVPYIVFGPPGTGKTKTVCEAVLQLCRHCSCTVLVTAPSNTAADLLLEKLSTSLSKTEMLRFMAFNRNPREVSSVNKSFTYSYDDGEGVFVQPPLEHLLKVKVVVATCCMAAKLFNLGVPRKHWDAIFIDECGHAVEPEAVAVFTAAHPKQLVIAGDPKQLGPVVRSRLANRYGLEKSYLERLGERTIYQRMSRGHDPSAHDAGTLGYENKVITKLVRNYRSHPDILDLPNKLFYDGHLQTCQDEESEAYLRSYSLAQWSELPVKGFPLIFNGIEGKNEREANSPSWFNIAECERVLQYVRLLAESKVAHRDIGIVTPYAKQVEKLTTLLRKNGIKVGGNELMIGSAEKFQGQERRVIIVSTVRSSENFLEFDALHNLGFVSNPKRFNVAVTRAQALLIIVGNARILAKDRCWGELLWMCHAKGSYTGMDLPPRGNAEDEEKRAAAMLEKLTDVQLDLDVSDDESAPSNVERETGVPWRDAD